MTYYSKQCPKQKFGVAWKIIWCDKNKLFHKKLFYVNQKKVGVARKSVSCRQKQEHAAEKSFLCAQMNH